MVQEGVLYLKTTLITLGSVTSASRAKSLLSRHGIRAKLVKSDSLRDGCSYGVEIPDEKMLDAAAILRSAGIDYRVRTVKL